MNARIPAEVFAPGEFLSEELETRGWSQTELAEILGRPPRLVNEIIAGKRAITPETAKGLAAAFGTSAQLWMNLETSYQLSKAKISEQEVILRAKLYGKFPVKEMIRRGWIEASENIDVLVQRFLEFFEMDNLDSEPKFAHAARKTAKEYSTNSSKIQLACLNRAKQIAKAVQIGKFSTQALRNAIPELRLCMGYTDEIRNVSTILAKAGVRLVIVEHLPGSKMDGACFWIDGAPVIALSLRFDRVDNFWFNLFHEIDHILHGEGKDDPIYEIIEQDAQGLPANEMRANEAAANYCVPKDEMDGFIARVNPLFSKKNIIGFAHRLNIHPGVVVGQLQNRKLIQYSFHREMLEKIRGIVTSSVLTDGFGNKIPL
jgi:HTH-type transcriptional regulator/antitoxin HigA